MKQLKQQKKVVMNLDVIYTLASMMGYSDFKSEILKICTNLPPTVRQEKDVVIKIIIKAK